jgi:hypothetical protein
VTPVIDQRLDLGERGALGPVVDCLRVRPAGLVDAAVEVLEVRLRDGEGEGVMASLGMDFFSVSVQLNLSWACPPNDSRRYKSKQRNAISEA